MTLTHFRLLAIVILILPCFVAVNSQKNFKPGFVISLSGDTLKGTINYNYWKINPEKIEFRQNEKDQVRIFLPLDIKKFGVYGELYVGAIVQSEVVSANSYDNTPTLKTVADTIFLQTIIKGSKSLYCYKNSDKKEQFYIVQDSKYQLLIYKKFYVKKAGNTELVENCVFRGQLLAYFKDSPAVQPELQNLQYTKDGLGELLELYYNSSGSVCEFRNFGSGSESLNSRKSEKIGFDFGALGGMSLTKVYFTGSAMDYLVGSDINPSFNFAGGLFLDIIFRGKNNKWSLYNELIYSAYEIKNSYRNLPNLTNYTIFHSNIGYSYIRRTNMLRYKYPIGNCFIFCNAGLTGGYVINEINLLKEEKVTSGVKTYSPERAALNETRAYEGGYAFGLGAKYKNFSLETRFEKGNGMQNTSTIKSSTSKYYFLLGYKF